MTNFEKIKTMTVEEMAKLLDEGECWHCVRYKTQTALECLGCVCADGVKQWLESEVEE